MVVLMPRPRVRLTIVSDGVFPSRWTDTQQIVKTASALADDGVSVDLVLPRQPHQWFARRATRRAELERYYGVRAGFTLTQLPGLPRLPFKINEALHDLIAPLYTAVSRPDVLYSRKLGPLILGLLTGQRVVLESHRVLRDHFPVAYRAVRILMRHPRFLGVVTNAQFIADQFTAMGIPQDAVLVAHNSFDPADVEPRLEKADARRQIGLAIAGPVVCYAGHIQKRKGIETVVAMAARTPDVHYLICGGFPGDVAVAQALAHEAGATNMTFTGWIDVHRLAPYLHAADVLLIPPTSAPLRRYGNTVLPIKTYTYLACGRAILAPRLDDTSEVLQHDRNAWLVAPDNLDAAVAGVRALCDDAARANRLGAAALADASRYTWQARASTIREFLERRVRPATPGAGATTGVR